MRLSLQLTDSCIWHPSRDIHTFIHDTRVLKTTMEKMPYLTPLKMNYDILCTGCTKTFRTFVSEKVM